LYQAGRSSGPWATAEETCSLYVIGEITDENGCFEDSRTQDRPKDLALEDMFGSVPVTFMEDRTVKAKFHNGGYKTDGISAKYAATVMQLESVAVKTGLPIGRTVRSRG
jgi:phosphoribosylformylglycinamidine synthase